MKFSRVLTLVSGLLLLLAAKASQAQIQNQQSPSAVGQSAHLIVQTLRERGVQKIGNFDLNAYLRDLRTISWRAMDSLPPASIAQGRRSAFYLTRNREVYVSTQQLTLGAEVLPQLELHEALGALGFNNDKYAISSALDLLARTNEPRSFRALLEAYQSSVFRKENVRLIGGSSVGGGGDSVALVIKNRVLSEIMSSGEPVTLDFLLQYPYISFEPFTDPGLQFVGLEYQLVRGMGLQIQGRINGVRQDGGIQEVIAVHFPALVWEKKPKKRTKIIEEIKTNILGIYPAFNSTQMVRQVPTGCDRSDTAPFPVSQVEGVLIIQLVRSGVLKGCLDKSAGPFEIGAIKVRAPTW